MALELDVVVLVAFDELHGLPSERAPWLERYDLDAMTLDIDGIDDPVLTDGRGLALVSTGIGKTAAATTITALCSPGRVDIDRATFITVGVSGGPPDRVSIGSVVIATSIVDWDLKVRWGLGGGSSDPPIGRVPYLEEPPVYRLASERVDQAADLVSTIDLDGGTVQLGTNVCGDELWHGEALARQVEWYVDHLGCEAYLATEMEDAGTACALDRVGKLDAYLSVRGIANFDRPTDGRPARDNLFDDDFEAGFERGLANAVEVGAALVEGFRDQ